MRLTPTGLVALVLAAYLGVVLARSGGNPLAFARLGAGFANGQPAGEQGYDGQFSYWLALDPRPAVAAPHLDVPPYRYQRILYPLLARLAAAGQAAAIPWTLVLVNLAAQVAGTWAVEAWLRARGVSVWYALTYGLWAGLVMAVRLDLNEPVCYALVAGALLSQARGRVRLAALALALAALAKETAVVFTLALIVSAAVRRDWREASAYSLALLPFALLQVLLRIWFGSFGLGAGGYLATSFEWIPYMGLWRIASVSVPVFWLLAALLVPLVVLPSVWGVVAAALKLAAREAGPLVWSLGANAAVLAFTPFSTFREPLGILRLATGLVLATVLFGAHYRSRRVLNYSLFWLSALAFTIRE